MKIIITGGTGFFGRHLVWRAAAEGAEVIFTGRNAHAAAQIIATAKNPVHWQPIEHGKGEQTLLTISRGADAIIHTAALSAPWGTREAFQKANVDSTREVIHACLTHAIPRFIHISTPSIYFEYRDKLNIGENAALPPPVNEYAASKWQAEQLVMAAENIPERVILRPRALFGEWDNTVLPRLLRVMAKGYFPLVREGQIMVDMTYIENAVEAVWLALTATFPRPVNIYNVTNGEPRYLKDLLQLVAQSFALPFRPLPMSWTVLSTMAAAQEMAARFCGTEPSFTRYSAGVIAFSQTLNISALQQELGWQAKIPLEAGIARHAAWWRGQKS